MVICSQKWYIPLHVYLIRSFVSRLNPTFLINLGFHQKSFPCPQKSGLKQPTLCKLKFELTHLRCLTFCLSLANLTWLERKDTIYCMFAIRLKATKESSCGINRWKIISSLPGNINKKQQCLSLSAPRQGPHLTLQMGKGIRLIST